MRIATWEAIETVKVGEVPEPEVGAADVLVAIGACGICGSDVHSYVEGAWIAEGQPLGHEFAGTVTAVGADVAELEVGDRIAVNPAKACGQCPRCLEGLRNVCSSMSGFGGGFADKVLFRDAVVGEQLFVLPDHVSLEVAAFLEPLSVAVRAVELAAPPLDEPIVVYGLGSIGQCVLQVLLARGASDVIVVDTSAVRREAARNAGAQEVIDPLEIDVRASVLASRGTTDSPYQQGGAVGTVFECSGAISVLPDAVTLLHAGGTLLLVALASRPAEVNFNDIVQKELRVLGSFAYTPDDCRAAFDLIAGSRVNVEPLISHRFDLDDIDDAFQAQRSTATSIKVMVRP